MSFMKLKSLEVSGPNKTTSSIEFGEKVTIIAGPSDSGKTCIFKCINYVLGASNKDENIPLDEQDGYDTIKLEMLVDDGTLILERKVNGKSVTVTSTSQKISSGEYLISPTKKNPKSTNDLFLNILGLDNNIKLPKNNKGQPASFTWRTIIQAFMVDEERADSKTSILLAQQNQPLYLASLIYLLTGDELSKYIGDKEASTIKKAKRDALIDYIKRQRTALETQKAELEEKMKEIGGDTTIEDQIKALNLQLDTVNEKIDKATSSNQVLSTDLIVVQDRLAKNKALMSRYETLNSQYSTDINRLTFIVDNENIIEKNKRPTKCPYCDHDMVPHDHSSYIAASRAELVKLVQKSNELEETKIGLQNQIDDDTDLIQEYKEEIAEANSQVKESLIPQRNKISTMLQAYNEYLRIKASLEYLSESDRKFEEDQTTYENEDINTFTPFNGKEILFDLIQHDIATNANEILEGTGYTPIETVEFIKKTVDLLINGKRKTNRGKGYKAFTNSVLLLAFQKLLSSKAEKNPHFYVFDSPLKGLSIARGTEYKENVRSGYFQYLIDNATDDQTIVIDNTNEHELPELQANEFVKIYEFTGNDAVEGRYGFLLDVRKK